MRQKSEQKREEILEGAGLLFAEYGLDGVSMSDIAHHLGASKATLYNYFSNKEDLFVEVMMRAACQIADHALLALDDSDKMPLRTRLARFGQSYLRFMLSKEMIQIRRMVYAHAERENIGRTVYDRGPKQKWEKVAAVLDRAVERQELRRMDSWRAAMQLQALFEADLIHRSLLCVDKKISTKKIDENVEFALDMFFAFYKK